MSDSDYSESTGSEGPLDTFTELERLFELRPARITAVLDDNSEDDSHFWFYDKHLDSNLALLHVKPMSSLANSIADVVDLTLTSNGSRGLRVPRINHGSSFIPVKYHHKVKTTTTTAESVGSYYCDTTADYCTIAASTIAVHPTASDWFTVLEWSWAKEPGLPSSTADGFSLWLTAEPTTKKFIPDSDLEGCLDTKTISTLQSVSERATHLATWEFLAATSRSKALLKSMGKSMHRDFDAEICRTSTPSLNVSKTIPPPDARSKPWSIGRNRKNIYLSKNSICAMLPPKSTRSQMSSVRRGAQATDSGAKFPVSIFGPDSPCLQGDSLIIPPKDVTDWGWSTKHLLQHAWNRAVRQDTTFIVFSCGNYERIGLRDRANQTLYLSDLLDVAQDRDPFHGRLHVGLYIASLQDAVDRAQQIESLEASKKTLTTPLTGTKRRADEDVESHRRRVRPKSEKIGRQNTGAESDSKPDILQEAGLRNLALVWLHYEVFNSPSPASFSRIGRSLSPLVGPSRSPRAKRQYLARDCLTIILQSEIGRGVTGQVHDATLQVIVDESILSRKIVVKLAFSVEQKERLRYEYDIYCHLVSSGVQGCIVSIYGLFEDMEGGAMALLMSNAGTSLEKRVTDDYDDIPVTESERDKFSEALKTIHGAGIRQTNIYSENLMVNEVGEVAIVGFGQAVLDGSEDTANQEHKKMQKLFKTPLA